MGLGWVGFSLLFSFGLLVAKAGRSGGLKVGMTVRWAEGDGDLFFFFVLFWFFFFFPLKRDGGRVMKGRGGGWRGQTSKQELGLSEKGERLRKRRARF